MTTVTDQAELFPGLFPEPPKTETPVRNRRHAPYGTHGRIICWRTPGGPRCWEHDDDVRHLQWGRTRSGRKWFWAAGDLVGNHSGTEHGRADTEKAAVIAAKMAVTRLAGGEEAVAHISHGFAASVLKDVNAAKRRARPPSDSTESSHVEYLYGTAEYENGRGHLVTEVIPFRIVKRTAKRVYYVRREHGDDVTIGYVDRARLDADGHIHNYGVGGYWAADCHLYVEPPDLDAGRAPEPSLIELKRAMAAAHPDKGGSSEAFIEARARYQRARARAGA